MRTKQQEETQMFSRNKLVTIFKTFAGLVIFFQFTFDMDYYYENLKAWTKKTNRKQTKKTQKQNSWSVCLISAAISSKPGSKFICAIPDLTSLNIFFFTSASTISRRKGVAILTCLSS